MLDWAGWDYGIVLASIVGVVASVTFITGYSAKAGKSAWNNPFGRFMLSRETLLFVLFSQVLANRLIGGIVRPDVWPGSGLVAFVTYGLFAIHTFMPYRLLIEAQRAHIKQEEESRNDAK